MIDAETAEMLADAISDEIAEKYGTTRFRGDMECPVCGGVLDFRVFGYEWKTAGSCETEGCLGWVD